MNATVRRLAVVWLALIALMLVSVGASTLHLGVGNTIAGLGIAALKALLVAWVFMDLVRAPALIRLIAAAALGAALILAGLSLIDFLVRTPDPAAYQRPIQLAPGQPFRSIR